MPLPLLVPILGGAALGAGLGAALGPNEEPLWKKLLIGGTLGGTAGLGLGAAGVGGGAAATTAGAGGTAAGGGGVAAANAAAADAALVDAGLQASLTPSIQAAAAPAAVPAATGPITTAQAAQNLGFSGPLNPATQGLSWAGAQMANHPFITAGGLGALGLLTLPGGDNGKRDGADETYPEPASWERQRQRPQFYGYPPPGGIGRGYYTRG